MITPFLTFTGQAEEAINLYLSVFESSEIIDIQRYGPGGPAPEGSVILATVSLKGQQFMCSDSFVQHEWTFTPAISLYVAYSTEEEIDRLHERLSEGGRVFMPLQAYPFSRKFSWVADRFGVSWQLSLGIS